MGSRCCCWLLEAPLVWKSSHNSDMMNKGTREGWILSWWPRWMSKGRPRCWRMSMRRLRRQIWMSGRTSVGLVPGRTPGSTKSSSAVGWTWRSEQWSTEEDYRAAEITDRDRAGSKLFWHKLDFARLFMWTSLNLFFKMAVCPIVCEKVIGWSTFLKSLKRQTEHH